MSWKTMGLAPKDGPVILTDEGTAIFVRDFSRDIPVVTGWYLCTLSGKIPSCDRRGISISKIEPSIWTEIPELTL